MSEDVGQVSPTLMLDTETPLNPRVCVCFRCVVDNAEVLPPQRHGQLFEKGKYGKYDSEEECEYFGRMSSNTEARKSFPIVRSKYFVTPVVWHLFSIYCAGGAMGDQKDDRLAANQSPRHRWCTMFSDDSASEKVRMGSITVQWGM